MSGLTATAPFISQQQEQDEREALSPQQRQQLWDEAYGLEDCSRSSTGITTPSDTTTPTSLIRINEEYYMERLNETLQSIPNTEKVEYLEALERCPDLVTTESPGIAFLRCFDFNVVISATRIVLYWRTRKLIFGSDLAFLPMTLDGTMIHDIGILSTKPYTLLAQDNDKHGRPILYTDRIRTFSDDFSRESAIRCTFYAMQVVCERKDPWKWGYGFVALFNFQGYELYKHYDRKLAKGIIMIGQCMPVKLKAVHICTGPGRSVLDMMLPILKLVWGQEVRLRLFHHAGSVSEISNQLTQFGFVSSHMDLLFKGLEELAYQANDFIEQRHQIEQQPTTPPP